MSESAIELVGVEKGFGPKEVLRGIDLSIPAGTIMGLIGKDGAGAIPPGRCVGGLISAIAILSGLLFWLAARRWIEAELDVFTN